MDRIIRQAFAELTKSFETSTSWFSCNARGLVTIGFGEIVDPVEYATVLHFAHADGRPVPRAEIVMAWRTVKVQPGYASYERMTSIRLIPGEVERLIESKLNRMDARLSKHFPEWSTWPEDAQLATLSVSWGHAAETMPDLDAALHAQDFVAASAACVIHPEVGGIVQRNALNQYLYQSAARMRQ